jgi:hypothetical protein
MKRLCSFVTVAVLSVTGSLLAVGGIAAGSLASHSSPAVTRVSAHVLATGLPLNDEEQ